jgi:hypothetical protein
MCERVDREILLGWLRDALLRLDPALAVETVVDDASLVYDLGMDSIRIEELVALIKKELSSADLTLWYVRASEGHDTVGALLDFLMAMGTSRTQRV